MRRHLDLQKHCGNAKALENQRSVTTFKSTADPIREKSRKIGVVLAHHNIPIAVVDHLRTYVFPDSQNSQSVTLVLIQNSLYTK